MAKKNWKRSLPRSPKQTKRERYAGILSVANGGFGFVAPDGDGPREIFIPPKFIGHAMHGDRVEVELLPPREEDRFSSKSDRGPAGRILSVLDRGREFVVAEMDSRHSARPLSKKLPDSIRINSVPNGVRPGEWVRLRLLKDGAKHTEEIRGAFEESLGRVGTVAGDLKAIESEFQLPPAYTEAQERAASKLEAEPVERRDLSDHYTLTIDPDDAKDFDDAISLMPSEKKTEWLLGVHIADVAAWVRPGSKFDKEAALRGFSSYIPGMFRPMLPKSLTRTISLSEGDDMPAHTVLFRVRNSDGRILSFERFHSLVRVNNRLSYAETQRLIDNPKELPRGMTPEAATRLLDLAKLVRKMRALRKKAEQFLSIETAEVRVLCDESTMEITALERKDPCEADRLVEECMLAANSAVAEELIRRNIPGLFRIHPEPTPEKILQFEVLMDQTFHLRIGDILSSRDACEHFLESLPNDPKKPVILSHFLRSLPRASYREEPELHYGLGKLKYSHFTSPIRRYPDLLVHQQLWAADCNARFKSKKILAELASDSSQKEEIVDNAYFEASDRLKIHYLRKLGADGTGVMHEAVINKITPAGLVCDIPDFGLFGFVPTHFLRGGANFRRTRERSRLTPERGHQSFKIGDFIYLYLDSVDLTRGAAIFRPVV